MREHASPVQIDARARSHINMGRIGVAFAVGIAIGALVYQIGPPDFLALSTPAWAWPIPFASFMAAAIAIVAMRQPRVYMLYPFMLIFAALGVFAMLKPELEGPLVQGIIAAFSWLAVVILPLAFLALALTAAALEGTGEPESAQAEHDGVAGVRQ